MTRFRTMTSPVGPLLLESDGEGLTAVRYLAGRGAPGYEGNAAHATSDDDAVLDSAVHQLEEYFVGARTAFDLPLRSADTGFHGAVWAALSAIPYGQTWSYREVAVQIGRPTAARAVGAACGRNPLTIVVPCHRVVGADRSLTGYGGGVEAKRALLALEARTLARHDVSVRTLTALPA
jgi:methylated-DNA-[protein]-cysteine S-methyltransferase